VAAVALACGSRPAAEDAVQDALARAWERSERGERIESLKAWVTKVALNLVRSGWRRALVERRHRSRARADERLAAPPRPPDDLLDLQRALAALPSRQREAVVLHYYLDLPVVQVASALGVTEGTVKTSLFRARHALALALGEQDLEEANDRVRH
jgi:RNA polymerase sigma-70 factor (ECF subfamily)